MSEIPNVIDLVWRAAASFSGGLCYLVVRRDLPPRKAVGVIVIAIAFGLFAADWVAQKTGIPGGVIGLAFAPSGWSIASTMARSPKCSRHSSCAGCRNEQSL